MFHVYRIKANGKRGAKSQGFATREQADKYAVVCAKMNKDHFGFEVVEQ